MKLPEEYTILSFDVTNLYTNIPTTETLQILKNILDEKLNNETDSKNIYKLFEICIQQNFCSFDGQYYTYDKGLPMGSPLSGLMADIFLNNLEEKMINNNKNPYNNNIIMWQRYVDDVLVVLNTKEDHITKNLHAYINTLHENIQFTLETEQDNRINFLDITIIKTDNELQFKIFRKKTQTDIVIPQDSNHEYTHKLAAFRAYTHRALHTRLQEDEMKKETTIIKQICKNNGYKPDIIDKIIIRQKNKETRNTLTTLSQNQENKYKTYIALEYQGDINGKMRKIFEKYNIKLTSKSNNTIGQLLLNNKDKINKLDNNGIYKLTCDTCQATYIGETGRSLRTRIKEHKNQQKSNFGRHLIFNKNHQFDENKNATIIHYRNKGNVMEALENYEINKFKFFNPHTICLNEQITTMTRPLYTYLNTPYTPPRKPPEERGFTATVAA
nr:uncharacterized protein LOC111417759 [Onthophagus taurus]